MIGMGIPVSTQAGSTAVDFTVECEWLGPVENGHTPEGWNASTAFGTAKMR
jgi:hypothetical protein